LVSVIGPARVVGTIAGVATAGVIVVTRPRVVIVIPIIVTRPGVVIVITIVGWVWLSIARIIVAAITPTPIRALG
jgi:hypothetical protein